MNRQISTTEEQEQWRINLRELRNRTGMTPRQIADKESLSEKSVSRVFSGEAKSPGVDLVRRIIHAMGGTWGEIFAESGAVIGGKDLVALQAEVERLTSELTLLRAEVSVLKEKNASLSAENDLLRLKLEYEEQIVALHNYYMKRGGE